MVNKTLIGGLGAAVYLAAENIWSQEVDGKVTSYIDHEEYEKGLKYLRGIPPIGPLSLYLKIYYTRKLRRKLNESR